MQSTVRRYFALRRLGFAPNYAWKCAMSTVWRFL